MEKKFEGIWYATEERAKSANVNIVYDQVCDLIIEDNRCLVLKNRNFLLQVNQISEIRLGRRRLNWKKFILIDAFVLILMINRYSLRRTILSILIANVLGVVSWATQTWIIIDGVVKEESKTIYILDGRSLGWAGKFGGTKKLFKELTSSLKEGI